jgi:predicted nucleotide-binding protein
MKVFIDSCSEAKLKMHNVASWLEEENHQALPWDEPGVFMPGDHLFTKLRKISQQVDAAIFIFSEDDKVWFREDMTTQPRDNILLEFGLLAGPLGAEKTIIYKKGKPKQHIDLQGILYVDLNRPNDARIRIQQWISALASKVTPLRLPTSGRAGIAVDVSHGRGKWQRGSIFDIADEQHSPLNRIFSEADRACSD